MKKSPSYLKLEASKKRLLKAKLESSRQKKINNVLKSYSEGLMTKQEFKKRMSQIEK